MNIAKQWKQKNSNIMKKDRVNSLLEMAKKFLALFGNPQNKKSQIIISQAIMSSKKPSKTQNP
jgi:hypothetical protein